MSVLKWLLAFFILVFVGLSGYYIYTKISRPKPTVSAVSDEPRVIPSAPPKLNTSQVAYRVDDLFSANLTESDTVTIEGQLQSAQPEQINIDGVDFVFVMGIVRSDKTMVRIHFTQEEYDYVDPVLREGVWTHQNVSVSYVAGNYEITHLGE